MPAEGTGSGVPLSKMAMFSTRYFRTGAIRRPPDDGLSVYLKAGMPPKRIVLRSQVRDYADCRAHEALNNRAGNSHRPLLKGERAMQGFRSPGRLQRSTLSSPSFEIELLQARYPYALVDVQIDFYHVAITRGRQDLNAQIEILTERLNAPTIQ